MNFSEQSQVDAIALLTEPLRQKTYEFVKRQNRPVTKDEVAKGCDLPRATASFHLEKLAEAGLLESEFRRLSGKKGPGAGRPNKLFRISDREITVSIPARRYDVAAEIMIEAIEFAETARVEINEALQHSAHEIGKEIGAEAVSLEQALEASGYEPDTENQGQITLGNCPFHQLSRKHTERICRTNLALLEGITEACAGAEDSTAVFAPGAGPCCVYIQQHHDQ